MDRTNNICGFVSFELAENPHAVFDTSMKFLCILLMFPMCGSLALAQKSVSKYYPTAKEGQVRFVIHVPMADEEEKLKVELIVGKTVPINSETRYSFYGKIEEAVVEDVGFRYYVVRDLGPMNGGNPFGIKPDAKPVPTFVIMEHLFPLLPYNSRMPIVVYLPEGSELRYRIWQAGKEEIAPKG